ncbi:mandelate racemase/muconate lactonizing enzyme family protein [Edaphobacter aggregans]|uniref:mandelate racemase/muconate lactonizing enzyme family protein n=1 Tax=Edaphobacter aggregans TaxID=570835 RepID=UPI001FE0E363|nr:mandelate racemase/muconate lactonizing enzyme family protein [Edaphobacter aggregans]
MLSSTSRHGPSLSVPPLKIFTNFALWDVVGKVQGKPISHILSSTAATSIPTYVSGVTGRTIEEQVTFAKMKVKQGATAFKIFWTTTFEEGLELVQQLRTTLPATTELFVDVLWRMTIEEALHYSDKLATLRVGWLEAPLPPEQIELRSELTRRSSVPIAIGESYRCHYDFKRFIDTNAASVLQPGPDAAASR